MTVGNNKVYGDLIEFDDPETLRKIDWLEGYQGEESLTNFYDRRVIEVFTDKEKFTAWAYFLSDQRNNKVYNTFIDSGRWTG